MARSKYGAVKTVVDGITFDSKKEAARYGELKLLERAGEIADLRLQVPFVVADAVGGLRERRYYADFVYFDKREGRQVIEDVKGYRTEVYKLKKQLVLARYPEYLFVES